ncbi:MAG TPA: hypothetical protein VFI65_21160 [Streptosporangiaceae bacterium]|nr:hypothetical protein [Streptosporangiaceae bacterium]
MLALGAGAICWALGGEWVSIRGHVPENHLVDVLTGLAFLAGGIVALDRRPGNSFGVLLLAFGFTWYLRNWGDGGLPWLVLLGTISGFAGPPLLAQIMLAYPTGRLRSGFDRVVVALIYAAAASACAVALLTFGAGSARGCVRCQWEPALFPTKAAYQDFAAIYVPASLALAVLVVLAVRRRWRRATRAER